MRGPRRGLTFLRFPVHTRHSNIDRLPNALDDGDELTARLAGRRLAVFLDYDGTLTPIVDRPEDALIPESMREAVRGLASLHRVRGQRSRSSGGPAADGGRRPGRRREPRLRHLEPRSGDRARGGRRSRTCSGG